MYLNYYNMEKAPFHITPDPEFLFLSPSHKEALGAIIYCIEERKGFVSVIGEVGTGKTTIVRSYLAKSDRSLVKPIYIFNPSVTFSELLQTIFEELGVEPLSKNVYDMVRQLHDVLIREFEQGLNIVLIIDEAQNMPVSTFEQLRILSNLETPKEKLLQIILIGQPELAEKLSIKELRQLNQRLAIRATLFSLSAAESREYIIFRLSLVRSAPHEVFTGGALKRIIKAAHGSPRMLNILCDNSLIAGFGYRTKQITGSIVRQVIADFEGKTTPPFFSWKQVPLIGALLLGLVVVTAIYRALPLSQLAAGQIKQPWKFRQQLQPDNQGLLAQAAPSQEMDSGKKEETAPLPSIEVDKKKKIISSGPAPTASGPPEILDRKGQTALDTALDSKEGAGNRDDRILPAAETKIVNGTESMGGKEMPNTETQAPPADSQLNSLAELKAEPAATMDLDHEEHAPLLSAPRKIEKQTDKLAVNIQDDSTSQLLFSSSFIAAAKITDKKTPPPADETTDKHNTVFNSGSYAAVNTLPAGSQREDRKQARSQKDPPGNYIPSAKGRNQDFVFASNSSFKENSSAGQSMQIVKKGDYLSQICLEKYGYVNDQLIEVVKKSNPQIFDENLIFVGDQLIFPEL